MSVEWSRTALQNVRDIRNYIALDDEQAAVRVLAEIEKAVKMLSLHPQMAPANGPGGSRTWTLGRYPYVIYYIVKKDGIAISRVLHSAQKRP